MKSVCIYCGSSPGNHADFARAAKAMGRALAERELTLVYGGGAVGLMGLVADACMEAGGRVTGVIPEFLAIKEVAHSGVKDMRIVASMHERKAMMEQLSDAFIALPGGIGTMEELFEIWTWAQLGQHRKPVGLMNAAGYFDGLIEFLDRMTDTGFVGKGTRSMLHVGDTPDALLDAFHGYEPPTTGVHIKLRQT